MSPEHERRIKRQIQRYCSDVDALLHGGEMNDDLTPEERHETVSDELVRDRRIELAENLMASIEKVAEQARQATIFGQPNGLLFQEIGRLTTIAEYVRRELEDCK